jgi:enhancing lycopene biosynthesis protein 2
MKMAGYLVIMKNRFHIVFKRIDKNTLKKTTNHNTPSKIKLMEKKKVLVLLAGSGAKDGSEIREAVLTLTAIEKAGMSFQCTAPNKLQRDVINFIDDSVLNEERNILVEAARIARGDILDLATVSMNDYDALAIPGGFGVAKNLCSFAIDGVKATVDADAKRIIREAFTMKKAILAICIAPALVALSLHDLEPEILLTLGLDDGPNQALETIGVKSAKCLSTECIVDEKNKIVSSPAYMDYGASLVDLDMGINKAMIAFSNFVEDFETVHVSASLI